MYVCVFDKNSYEFSKSLFMDLCRIITVDDKHNQYAKAKEMRTASATIPAPTVMAPPMAECGSVKGKSLDEYIGALDKSFAYKLFDLIDASGMTDVECYKKANVDKKTFSKIKCNPQTYKPSKQTAVAFAIALKLNLDETQDLLASAGLTLSRSYVFDKIIRYFIQKEIYDIFDVNQALFEFDQVLLGC